MDTGLPKEAMTPPPPPVQDAPRSAAPTLVINELSIDGVVPTLVVAPATAAEAAATLAEAAQQRLAVAPVGGGTALALGNPPEKVDIALSTARLGGILDYEPTDLVLSVGAGARLGDVQAVLAEHGQGLPIDPPGGDAATIGGLIATALVGPRRLGSGTLRDLLIGIAVAHPSGAVSRAGGMVVKNVSGYDLPRVYHGSLGTLGLIVSANFKVLPLPRRDTTILAAYDTLPEALAAADRIRQSRVRPAALEVTTAAGAWGLAGRLLGRPDATAALTEEAARLTGTETWTIDAAESADWWREYVTATDLRLPPAEALLHAAVRPRETATLAEGVVALLDRLGIEAPAIQVSPGLGLVTLRVRLGNEPDPAARLAELLALLGALADHASVLAAPPDWKRGLDVWGRQPETLDLMRALKQEFDPDRVLNPGRFVGFI